MSRYIDADLAIKDAETIDPKYIEAINSFKSFIYAQPTADVVEVVMCKDCKYYEPNGVCANINFLSVSPNDYCSYAERTEAGA